MSPRNLELVVNDQANCNLVVNANTEKYLIEIRQANGDKPVAAPKKPLKPHIRNRPVVSTFTVKSSSRSTLGNRI